MPRQIPESFVPQKLAIIYLVDGARPDVLHDLLEAGEPVGFMTRVTAAFYNFVNIGHDWAGSWAGRT